MESTIGVESMYWFKIISVAKPLLSMEGAKQRYWPNRLCVTERSCAPYSSSLSDLKLVEKVIACYPDIILLVEVIGDNGSEIARASNSDVIPTDINPSSITAASKS